MDFYEQPLVSKGHCDAKLRGGAKRTAFWEEARGWRTMTSLGEYKQNLVLGPILTGGNIWKKLAEIYRCLWPDGDGGRKNDRHRMSHTAEL